jgi:hypothetical protein
LFITATSAVITQRNTPLSHEPIVYCKNRPQLVLRRGPLIRSLAPYDTDLKSNLQKASLQRAPLSPSSSALCSNCARVAGHLKSEV